MAKSTKTEKEKMIEKSKKAEGHQRVPFGALLPSTQGSKKKVAKKKC